LCWNLQEIARAAGPGVADSINLDVHAIAELKEKGFPPTNDAPKYSYEAKEGVYSFKPCTGVVKALRHKGKFVDQVTTGQLVGVLLDQTSFYAEQGGQIYDTGFISKVDDEETELVVRDTQVRGGYVLHIGVVEGSFKVGDKVNQQIDEDRRKLVMNNHTGTHVLNFALRKVLGEADQRGSLVAPDRLRFDFTSKGAMTAKQVKEVEEIALDIVKKGLPVHAKECSLSLAKEIQGLRAVFDEVYPDPVRVLSIGMEVDKLVEDPAEAWAYQYSVEFCGGSHLRNSGHIESFALVTEEAIAKGIRRIVALTGPEATKAHRLAEHLEKKVDDLCSKVEEGTKAGTISTKEASRMVVDLQDDLSASLISAWYKEQLRAKLKALKKSVDDADRARKAQLLQNAVEKAKAIIARLDGQPFIVDVLEVESNTKALDAALKQFRSLAPQTAALLFSVDRDNKKIVCLSSVPKELTAKGLKADEWVRSVSELMRGKGGGKDVSAQASGDNVDCLDDAVVMATEFANSKF
jgi:alanyl-tRNA synthetase